MWKMPSLPEILRLPPDGAAGGGDPAPAGDTPADQGSEEPAAEAGNGLADISALIGLASDKPEGEAPPEGAKPPASSEAAPDGGKAEIKPGEPGAPTPEPGKDQPKPEGTPPKPGEELASALRDVLKEVRAEQPKEPEKPKAPDYVPKYANVQIPDEILAAIEHQDPKIRKQGLAVMLGASMTKVYDDLKADIRAEIDASTKQVPTMIQAFHQQQEALKAINIDFFSNFKQFDTPAGRKLVPMAAMQLATQMGKDYKGWTTEFRNKLGETLIELTGLKTAAPAEPSKGGQKPAGTPPKSFNSGTGARPASAGEKSLVDEITEVTTLN